MYYLFGELVTQNLRLYFIKPDFIRRKLTAIWAHHKQQKFNFFFERNMLFVTENDSRHDYTLYILSLCASVDLCMWVSVRIAR